jgi:FAD/FMN-containing dehydrogenase
MKMVSIKERERWSMRGKEAKLHIRDFRAVSKSYPDGLIQTQPTFMEDLFGVKIYRRLKALKRKYDPGNRFCT